MSAPDEHGAPIRVDLRPGVGSSASSVNVADVRESKVSLRDESAALHARVMSADEQKFQHHVGKLAAWTLFLVFAFACVATIVALFVADAERSERILELFKSLSGVVGAFLGTIIGYVYATTSR